MNSQPQRSETCSQNKHPEDEKKRKKTNKTLSVEITAVTNSARSSTENAENLFCVTKQACYSGIRLIRIARDRIKYYE